MEPIHTSGVNQKLSLITFAKKVDSTEHRNQIFSLFRKKFSEQVIELRELKENNPNLKNHYSLILNHKILHKIIDLIGERQYALKNKESNLLPDEIFSITELNDYFSEYFLKYSETSREITWKGFIRNSKLLFLHSIKLLDPVEIQQKKKLADKGYSMFEQLEKWITNVVEDEKISYEELFLNFAKEFLEWADTHPKTASGLISDFALTCSVLLEKDVSERLFIALDAMIVSRLFFDALGLSPEFEEVEDDDLLKFRALADFTSYCPKGAAAYNILKKTARGEFKSLFEWVTHALKEGLGTAITQEIKNLVPKGKEQFVSFLVDVVRGKEVREILAHQRNLTLIRIAGAVRKAVKVTPPFFLFLEIWWKTIFEAKGQERNERMITQILLPASGLLFFSFIFLAKYEGPPLVVLTKLITLIFLSAISFLSSYFLTHLIDEKTKFKAKHIVENAIAKRENQLLKRKINHYLLTNKEMKDHIREQASIYIDDLQKKYALPASPQHKKEYIIDSKSNAELLVMKDKYLNKLKAEEGRGLLMATHAVAIFNETLNLKKIREKLDDFDAEKSDAIIFSLVDILIKEWLQGVIEKSFKDKLIESSEMTQEDSEHKFKINAISHATVDKYFKTKCKSIDNPYQKTLYQKAIYRITSENKYPHMSL